MFERFTQESRDAVVGAQEQCRALGHPVIEPSHLLLALLAGSSPVVGLLEAHGVTAASGAQALRTVLGDGAGPTEPSASEDTTAEDAAALAALGFDLERIRAAMEASFGPGALERAAKAPRRPRRPGLPGLLTSRRGAPYGGGHLPFGADAKKALELSLREAVRLGDGYIGAEHLLLGLLRDEGGVAVRMFRVLDVDTALLRRDVENGRRRSA